MGKQVCMMRKSWDLSGKQVYTSKVTVTVIEGVNCFESRRMALLCYTIYVD